jgi:hypothetical protein
MVGELAGLFLRLEAGEGLELGISERSLRVENAEFVLRMRRMSILLGLAITENIILTRFDADSSTPPFLESLG